MESGQFGMQTDQNQMSSICFPTGKAHADNCSCTQAVSESAGKTSSVETDVKAMALPDGRCKLCPHLGAPGQLQALQKPALWPREQAAPRLCPLQISWT